MTSSRAVCWSQVSRAVSLRPNRRVHLVVSRGRDFADRYSRGLGLFWLSEDPHVPQVGWAYLPNDFVDKGCSVVVHSSNVFNA